MEMRTPDRLFSTPYPVLDGPTLARLRLLAVSAHHDDDGHISAGEFRAAKPFFLPDVAEILGEALGRDVDAWCQIYRLDAGAVVPRHVDSDFHVGGRLASRSVLVRLNDGYEGGETVFTPGGVVDLQVGHALVFPHHILHEGLPVTRGVKFVLKTDVLG